MCKTFGAPQFLNENSDYLQMDFSQPQADAEVLVADNTSVETNDAKLTHSAAFTFICATRSLLKMNQVQKNWLSNISFGAILFSLCEVERENACPHFWRLSWYLAERTMRLESWRERTEYSADDKNCLTENWECTNKSCLSFQGRTSCTCFRWKYWPQ